MKKKIMHLFLSNIYSGAENVAITIIEQLKDKYDFTYVCRSGPIINILKEKNINYIILNKMSVWEIKNVIKNNKPDLVHAHGFTTSVRYAFTNCRVPYISHLHNNKPWLKSMNIKSYLYLLAAKKAKKILTVSESIKNEYVFSKKVDNKFYNIGNPVSMNKVLDKVNSEKKSNQYDICCVARLTEQKNPEKFLRIISNLKKMIPEIKAVWVGDGDMKDLIINKVNKLGLNKNIEFIGFKKNPYKYMYNSKLFVLTSDWEGYGLVAFEAIALGIPCVVSNVGGLPNIVDSTCGKLCNDDKDFIDEIINLLQNHEEYAKRCKGAIQKAKVLENLKEYVEKIDDVYQENIKKENSYLWI